MQLVLVLLYMYLCILHRHNTKIYYVRYVYITTTLQTYDATTTSHMRVWHTCHSWSDNQQSAWISKRMLKGKFINNIIQKQKNACAHPKTVKPSLLYK